MVVRNDALLLIESAAGGAEEIARGADAGEEGERMEISRIAVCVVDLIGRNLMALHRFYGLMGLRKSSEAVGMV